MMAMRTEGVRVMGILNVTPDSFSDGGKFHAHDVALRHVEQMLLDGATIIDVGGESTRPGAQAVTLQAELDRVVPVIEAINEHFEVLVSVDTSKSDVMRAAVAAGAGMINDVRALQEPGALAVCADLSVPICLMHMQGEPRTMQQNPQYADVVWDVYRFFKARIQACEAAGIGRERLILDPGFGFGKTLQHNVALLFQLRELQRLNLPLLVGLSRKSMIGALLGGVPVEQRVSGSVSAAVMAAVNGASIVRVHDVKETVEAISFYNAALDVWMGS